MSFTLTGKESLGIEFGSTRIKAVLIDENFIPVATGSFDWENSFVDGYWTYDLDDAVTGMQVAYERLNDSVFEQTGKRITTLASIGISAMMHGFIPWGVMARQLTDFRTWRNTTTSQASKELTELFGFNIPQRWSIAHLYQAILDDEPYINDIVKINTLAGYIHLVLTDQNVVGVGEASGMFPIDSKTNSYDKEMLEKFSQLDKVKRCGWNIAELLPKIKVAGECAGHLTSLGAAVLDPSYNLQPGIPFCPPEGDAGTGMVATNSVRERTGNVSAGTSIFSMIVLEKPLSKIYEKIDMVTTPTGKPVAMVHCNNCCTDLDYWVKLFIDFSNTANLNLSKAQIYDLLYNTALNADNDCGGIVNYNLFSGEPVADLSDGVPLFMRKNTSDFNLSNFMRSQIYSTMASLKIGMEILENENVVVDKLMGHGGLFKTPIVGQKLMAGAMNTPVAVMDTAGEGGAWGIAILAKYSTDNSDLSLEDYLDSKVFSNFKSSVIEPDDNDVKGFNQYMKLFKKGLAVEKYAAECL